MTEQQQDKSEEITNQLSLFFDLLAKFDYEDKQKEKLAQANNSDIKPATRASGSNCSS